MSRMELSASVAAAAVVTRRMRNQIRRPDAEDFPPSTFHSQSGAGSFICLPACLLLLLPVCLSVCVFHSVVRRQNFYSIALNRYLRCANSRAL